METLKLYWLGHPQVERKGRTVKLETRKGEALLAYLSLTPGECSREILATMFWPEGNQQKALANLRRSLSSLNSSLPGWLEADREALSLKRNARLWVDVDAFHQSLSKLSEHTHPNNELCEDCLSVLDRTAQLYRGDFLEGLNLSDSPIFDEWQFFQRDGLRQEFAAILQRLSSGYFAGGHWDQAIIFARRWVALDRLHEPACRALMDLYDRSGQRAAALRQYEELARSLNEQMGQEPEEETRRLYDRIRRGVEPKRVAASLDQPASFPLLKTKLYIPTAPASRVERSLLIARLGEVEKKALTIISAPAGFGKTTLLAEWIAQTSLPVAWLSLDNGDNDPYRFLSYLISAIESIHEEVGVEARQIMQSAQFAPPHIILTSLINDLTRVVEPYAFVLDDYQFIIEHAVDETLSYLLDHLPANMHLVISTRADPPLQLGRLRAHGQMLELRSQDLRFTRQEATQLLNDVMRLGLSAEDIEILEAHTEGWVVGLKMAALSIQGRDDATGFIRAFSGSHRYVLDYLVEEVLRRQPAHIQTFLLETSILGKLSGPLCDALMSDEWKQAGEGGQAVLEYLERSNLFVIPLDERKQWYRYHHLFADLLHSRLQQFSMEYAASLHTKASQWFEINGLYEEALFHSIRARDFTRAVSLIEQSALPVMARNDFSTCLLWLEAIPHEVSENHPLLCIYKAWICARLGRIDEVEPLLQRATGLMQSRATDAGTREMAGYAALVRANVANLQGNTAFAVEQTEKAREFLSIQNALALDNVSFQRGFAYFVDGDFASAREVWLEAARSALAIQDFDTYANTMAELADLNKLEGKLRQAYQLYQDARKELERHSCPVFFRGVLEIGIAELMTEWNKLEDAHRLISEGIDHAQKGERPNTVCFGYYVKSRLFLALNQLDHAQAVIAQAEKIRSEHALYPRAAVETESAKVRLWITQRNLEAASGWLKHHQPDNLNAFDFRHELEYITCARILIVENHVDRALELLITLARAAESGKRTGRLIEILCLYALALQASGRPEEANMILAKSLCLAEPEGYRRVFLDEGKPMIGLLEQLLASKSTTELTGYIKGLLEAGPQR